MAYGATFHKSSRELEDEGPPFAYTAANRARFDEIVTRYPPDRRRSAVLPALYLAQYQQGYITANAIRYVAGLLEITPADVEDVVSFYTMFYTRPVGAFVLQVCRTLSCALNRARHRGAAGEAGHPSGRDRRRRHVHADRSRMPGRLRSRAGRHGQ
jgi:NADH-quinone oxidoreductase subunit E